jgi:predicted dehydrogenase
MKTPQRVTRRAFLGTTAALGATTSLLAAAPEPASVPPGPNDRIRLGFIGVGDRGSQLVGEFLRQPGAEIVAICDVWKERRDKNIARCPSAPTAYNDYRELLARDDIDAVVIATPPHWHAIQAIDACEAGKDIYLEKPMTISVGESLAVARAVKKHRRITQMGTQIHAEPNYHHVVEIIRSGALGKINVARTMNVGNMGPEGIGFPDTQVVPEGLDWDRWCGPAPLCEFNPLLAKRAFEHASFLDYSGGWTPAMAGHILDLPFWALNLGCPKTAMSTGGRYLVKDCGDGYDTHEAMWQFDEFTLTWTTSIVNAFGMTFPGPDCDRRTLAIAFHGANGTLLANYGEHDIHWERGAEVDTGEIIARVPEAKNHYQEFLDCVRTREQPSCHIGYHYKLDVAVTLSLLSLKLGRSVAFDPETETIPDDRAANKLLFPEYRGEWRIPRAYRA